jgi:hypothetical protein
MVSLIWLAAPAFVFSIVIMWESMRAMLSKKSIREFLPFFLLSMVLSFYGGAIVFEVFYGSLWMVLELSILICLIWILINIKRKLLW